LPKKCTKAVVFLDAVSTECLHWSGGIGLLHKAVGIREFSVFESAPHKFKKGVFVISGPVVGASLHTLQSIIQSSKLEYVVVISNCHPTVQTWAQTPAKDWNTEDRSGFDKLEEEVLVWMGNVNYTVEIMYLPLFIVAPCTRLLITPSFSRLFPLIEPDLIKSSALWRNLNPGQALPCDPGDWASLPHELQSSVRHLAASLNSMLNSLGVREEIFSIGKLSKCLGDQLESWGPARTRRKSATGRVSLVLVDRTLDLASCVRHSDDTLLARAIEALPRLPGHSVDVEVDLSTVFGMEPGSNTELVPGSLVSPGLNASKEEEELESIFFNTEKECLNLLHKHLIEASPKKKVETGKKYVSGSTLETDLKVFIADYEALFSNLSTICRSQCAVTCLSQEHLVRRKRLHALAAQFARLICEGGDKILGDVTDLVRGRKDNNLKLDDILMLLVFVYSCVDIRDAFPQDQEDRLRSVMGEALLNEGKEGCMGPVLTELCQNVGESCLDEVVALSVINIVWERLEGLKGARSELSCYQSLINYDGEQHGLLELILRDIYHQDRRDVESLHHHAGGIGAMLRSGLGWLGSAPAKPHPRESPWIILFVLGGVTPGEIAASQNLVKGTGRLTIGGTNLLSPLDALKMTFINNPLLND